MSVTNQFAEQMLTEHLSFFQSSTAGRQTETISACHQYVLYIGMAAVTKTILISDMMMIWPNWVKLSLIHI